MGVPERPVVGIAKVQNLLGDSGSAALGDWRGPLEAQAWFMLHLDWAGGGHWTIGPFFSSILPPSLSPRRERAPMGLQVCRWKRK